MQYIIGKWISKPIYVAAELCIADMLTDGPKSIEELARESNSHAPSLYRVLRALASVGIFSEIKDKHFELTPMAELLKSGALRPIALMFNSYWSDQAWEFFLDSVKTGDTAFEKAHGLPVSEWLEENPHAAEVFNEANAIKAAGSHRAIIDAYDFSGINKLTDVGGGFGVLMAEILAANPHLQGVVADLPSVIREARKVIQRQGLGNRCDVVECDFFKDVPSGSDAYLLSNILHDWSDEKCKIILKNCHRAMKTDSKLVVVEMIISPGNEPSIAKLLDLEMMVTTSGRERTESEFKDLFTSSGLILSRIIPTKENIFLLDGSRN
jgi:hypothetical protein